MQTAAFVLADLWTGHPGPTTETGADIKESNEAEAPLERLAFEPEIESLTPDLSLIMTKVEKGERLDARSFLERVPQFRGIDAKPRNNNQRQDAKGRQDRMLKAIQQKLMNMLRPTAYSTRLWDPLQRRCSRYLSKHFGISRRRREAWSRRGSACPSQEVFCMTSSSCLLRRT